MILSPSGNFSLTVEHYKTKEHCWQYSKGIVKDKEGKVLFEVERNYSSFPHLFFERKGEEWLIAGKSYMSQNIYNLTTGKEYYPKKDNQFCWSTYKYNAEFDFLIVNGCFWAGPYVFKFFDFSNPEEGWPEISKGHYIPSSGIWPEVNQEGKIVCFETKKVFKGNGKDEDHLSDEDFEHPEIDNEDFWYTVKTATKTFSLLDKQLVLIDEWISEEQIALNKINEEGRKQFEEKISKFQSSDPLYLEYQKLCNENKDIIISDYEAHGGTYKGWAPMFDKNEIRWCRRLIDGPRLTGKLGWTVDLEWAIDTGPIKLEIYKDGNTFESKYFGHSVEEMQKAFDFTIKLHKENLELLNGCKI